MFRAFFTSFMWLFQISQDQEGLRQFHDSIFSPVSSEQCNYTFIWGKKNKNENLLLTHHAPSSYHLWKATKIKVDHSFTLTNTHTNSSPKTGSFSHTDSFLR